MTDSPLRYRYERLARMVPYSSTGFDAISWSDFGDCVKAERGRGRILHPLFRGFRTRRQHVSDNGPSLPYCAMSDEFQSLALSICSCSLPVFISVSALRTPLTDLSVEHVTGQFSWISILGRLFFVESRYRLYLNGASVSVVGPYVA